MKRYTHTHSKLNNRVTIREMSTVNHLKNLHKRGSAERHVFSGTDCQPAKIHMYMFGG